MKFAYYIFWMTAISLTVMADEFYEVKPDYEIKGIPYPDHLTPVGPFSHSWHREYIRRVEDHLYLVDADICRYVVRPSFGPESCVAIRSEVPKEVEEELGSFTLIPNERKKYFITVIRAAENLWYSMAKNNEERKTQLVETSRVDREISLELAGAIQWVWGRMLHHTRNPAKALVDGKDGCVYEFSAAVSGIGYVSGATWSPQGGLTAELVSLGDKVSAFASEKGTPEEPLLKLLNDFEAKIPETEPSRVFVQEFTDGPVDPFAPSDSIEKKGQNKSDHGR